jgi:Holliday junction resolvase-like predicted endonuclease
MPTERQQRGRRAEELAAEFMRAAGCEIVQCNYRRRLGELDIVARTNDVLVVAEVRTRTSNTYGGAAASVDRRIAAPHHACRDSAAAAALRPGPAAGAL